MPQPDVRRRPAGNRTPSNHIADHDTRSVRAVRSLEDVANAEMEMRSKALEIGHLADQAARTGSARDVVLTMAEPLLAASSAVQRFVATVDAWAGGVLATEDDLDAQTAANEYLLRLGYGGDE